MVDLIYADAYGREVDMLPWFAGEFSVGVQNNFSVKVPPGLGIEEDWYLMIPETEFGGIVDDVDIDTSKPYATVGGRTWQGMLQGNVVEPDEGKSHYVCSGDLNDAFGDIIARLDLTERIMADPKPSGFTVSSYAIRNQPGYQAMRDMARSCGAKVRFRYDGKLRKCVVSAVARADHSDDGVDGDAVKFRIKRKRVANAFFGYGKGEGASRITVHRYMDEDGNLSDKQTLFGVKRIVDVYDSPNSELAELIEGIEKRAREKREDKLACSMSSATSGDYDIGDIVGGTSTRHNFSMVTEVAQKIAKVTPQGIKCETKTAQEVK